MTTFADIINLWPKPSPVTFGADMGELAATIRAWRSRKVLPDRKWKATVEHARRRGIEGVTLEILAEIAARGDAAAATSEAAPETSEAGASA